MDIMQVQAAISALYGADASEAARANSFLMEFTEQPAAWSISVELLSASVTPESASPIQYFSANTLYTKVRKHWHQLDAEHRDQIGAVILQLLRRNPSVTPSTVTGGSAAASTVQQQMLPFAPVVINRLCLALASVAVRAPNGIEAYVREAFALCQSAAAGTSAVAAAGGGNSAKMVALSLEMIKILPQEVDGADLSRSRRLELQDQVREHTPTVLRALESVLADCVAEPPADNLGVGGQPRVSGTGLGSGDSRSGRGLGSGGICGGGETEEVILAALECLKEWAKLGVSLGGLATDCPLLLDRVLRLVRGEGGRQEGAGAALPTACAASEVIAELVVVKEYPRPRARDLAAEAVLGAMEKMPPLFATAMQTKDHDSASALCNSVVSFAQEEMPLVAGAEGKGLPLVELLLSLTACDLARIPVLTLDFWLELQDVQFSERHPSLGRPVYVRLLDVLLSKCEFPEGFVSWEDQDADEADEDSFTELREGAQGVKDVLVVIYYLLRADFLSHLMDKLKARPESWQALEVTLLAVTLVSKEVRDWMDAHSRGKDAERAEDARRSHALVSALLNELLLNESLSSVPMVLAAGCKLVGSFATLVGGGRYGSRSRFGPVGSSSAGSGVMAGGSGSGGDAGGGDSVAVNTGSLLPRALGYLSAGLRQGASRDRAAIAVRTLGASCERAIVGNPVALEALLQTLEVATQAGADIEERLTLVEASVRVLPSVDPATGSAMLMRLMSPLLHVLAQGLQSPTPDESEISEALQLLAQAVRFLDVRDMPYAPPPGASAMPGAATAGSGSEAAVSGSVQPPHLSAELVQTLWPMLEAVPGRLGGSPEIAKQLFMMVGKMLTSLRMVLARQVHIPTLLKMIMDCYDERQYPCCLDVMTTAVEVYGGADEAVEHFRAVLGRASARTFTTVQAAARPGEVPQLVRAYFELLFRFLLFCPAALLGSAELETALQLAVACVGASDLERESARAVLVFLGQLAGRCGGQLDRYQGEVEAALAPHGEALTRLMFAALAGASPSLLWPNLIDALYALLRAFSEPQHQGVCQQWVFGALRNDQVCATLGEEERKHVMDAVFRLLSDSRSRFKALMLDLAKICHNEMTKDGLLAYFL